jgi:MmyB-like transcription regulator ligand binding domain
MGLAPPGGDCASGLRDLVRIGLEGDVVRLGAAAHAGVEGIDGGQLRVGELEVEDVDRQPDRAGALRPAARQPRAAGQQRAVHVPGPGGPRVLPRLGSPGVRTGRFAAFPGRAHPHDRALHDLIGELSIRSDEFRVRWAAHNVRFHRAGSKRLHHPVVGELEVRYETMTIDADEGLCLAIYTCETESTSQQALDLLASWTATPHQPELHETPDQP